MMLGLVFKKFKEAGGSINIELVKMKINYLTLKILYLLEVDRTATF
jgi:hypothetical protein